MEETKETNKNIIGLNVSDHNMQQLDEISEVLYGKNPKRMQSTTMRYCINYTHRALLGKPEEDKEA